MRHRSIQEITADRAARQTAEQHVDVELRVANLERLKQSGWTVNIGEPDSPVITGTYQATWPQPPEFDGWLIYGLDAWVNHVSTSGDITIWIYRIRNSGGSGVTVASMIETPITILEGEKSSLVAGTPQPDIDSFGYFNCNPTYPTFDAYMIEVDTPGTGAQGLSVNVAVGMERVPDSGYH